MVRINENLCIPDLGVQVSHLEELFKSKGMPYLSEFIAEANQLYEGITYSSCDTVLRDALIDGVVSKANAVAFLCVYLAIAELAHVYDIHATRLIMSEIWNDRPYAAYNMHPYAVAIKLASMDATIMWIQAMRYSRENSDTRYLPFVTLRDIHYQLRKQGLPIDDYRQLAANAIQLELGQWGIKYDLRW